MRTTIQHQQKLVPIPDKHQHAKELKEVSRILDSNPEILLLVHADLVAGGINQNRGRKGMTAEQVLRALVIKQMNGFSYEMLAFHICDSICFRSFCRIGYDQRPQKKTLQRNIKKLKPETLEAINRLIIKEALNRGVEKGRTVRTDCTVEETNIHAPSDSSLLFDLVRVLSRTLRMAKATGFEISFVDHTRGAKRRSLEIKNETKDRRREKLYRKLVKLTEEALGYAVSAALTLKNPPMSMSIEDQLCSLGFAEELEHFIPLGQKVLDQTKRRVFDHEKVPASEKIVSIFEPHTDIIVKARRETQYGHKLCLTTGKSGLILDCLRLTGNPADSTLAVTAVERQKAIYGRLPRQVSFDGGFASNANLSSIKALGVKDVMFHKKRGLKVHEMVKSSWVYKNLKRFRAGIEAGISFLKRCFGLGRCLWRGEMSFEAYTWSSVLSANLLILARHALA